MVKGQEIVIVAVGVGAVVISYMLGRYFSSSKRQSVRSGLSELVGNTPLVYLGTISRLIGCEVYGKADFLNPGGSVKDRFALRVARKAASEGFKGIVEATSGSTGISLTLAGLSLGLKSKIFVPDDQAPEKISMLRSIGASVQLTRPATISDPGHMCKEAERFSRENPEFYYTDQFENEENFKVHYETTGPEILQDAPNLNVFVAAAGTGGAIAGISAYLKQALSRKVTCILADVQGSALTSKINHGILYHSYDREGHRVKHPVDTVTEGIGLNRLTFNFESGLKYVDSAIVVTDAEAVHMAYYLLHKEGLFLGSSTAVNCAAVVKAWKRGLIKPGSVVCTILCDSGSRHLSKFWSHRFLDSKGLLPSFVDPVTGQVDDPSLIPDPLSFIE